MNFVPSGLKSAEFTQLPPSVVWPVRAPVFVSQSWMRPLPSALRSSSEWLKLGLHRTHYTGAPLSFWLKSVLTICPCCWEITLTYPSSPPTARNLSKKSKRQDISLCCEPIFRLYLSFRCWFSGTKGLLLWVSASVHLLCDCSSSATAATLKFEKNQ